jgi:hypothetical protein
VTSCWCEACGSFHAAHDACAIDLAPTGPETPGWRVNVTTGRGIEAYGVLVAPCGDVWRARILTFPNVLWKAPGHSTTIKFVGHSAREVLDRAIAFVRAHCDERGYTVRGENMLGSNGVTGLPASRTGIALPAPAARKLRFLPVRFGVVRPSESAGTGNVSETGMFIITRAPIDPGHALTLLLRAGDTPFDLKGCVIWTARERREADRPPGMGIRLIEPPRDYVSYVRALP